MINLLSVIIQVISIERVQAETALKLLLVTAVYFMASWLLIRNSHKITTIIYHLFEVAGNKPEDTGLAGFIDNFGSIGNRYNFISAMIETIVAAIVPGFSKKITYRITGKSGTDEIIPDSNPAN